MSILEPQSKKILDFWFGELDEAGNCSDSNKKRWFMKDAAFDREILETFSATYAQLAVSGVTRPDWAEGPHGTLAAIIVLDQFSRNMFRNTPAMFSADSIARSYSYEMIALGYDRALAMAHRTFVYMPLMHSERLCDQERCIELFESFAAALEGKQKASIEANTGYAVRHRDIVARFGRFPHRNDILGRPSTAEELAFLKQPGSGF